ncbi:hypothetical protein [Streptomyces carpaticus]|uniref:Uncharacterized protein n=1 Tax=Streptomyces carpaticus TaxID=285558 RepID=A0ABV4ZMQ9_9ACTN
MDGEPQYRALLAVDIAGSAGRGDVALGRIRAALSGALRASLAHSGVDWDACLRQDLGDGLRVVAPAGTPKASLVHPLIHELAVRLRAHNRLAAEPAQVRVRLALHAGDVHLGPDGTAVGRPLEVLARLLDAEPARAALAGDRRETVAALLSQHFHEETVCQGRPGIDPASFHQVAVRHKEFTAPGWLHLPGGAPEAAGPAPGADAAARIPDTVRTPDTARMISKASGHGVIYAVQNGTLHIGRTT